MMRDSLEQLIGQQRAFFEEGQTHDLKKRLSLLEKLETALVSRREELLETLANDLGKPEIEAFLAEYYFLLTEIRLVRKKLKKWLKPRRVGSPIYFWPCRSWISPEAYGMVLIIAPWNYPIQLSLAPLISAVAAGNTVILKPSEYSPASERFLTELINEVFPPAHVTVVTGGVEVSKALLDFPYDFVFFTGSTEVGRIVAQKAAQNLTPHALELGGKCPCVVDRTADIETTARRILIGKLFNAGQTCFSPDFIAVHEEVKAGLVTELKHQLESHPWEKEMARMIHRNQFDRLQKMVSGEVIQKGEDDAETLHLAPKILPEASWNDPAMEEEIFGPILPVVSFSDKENLVAQLKKYSSPLALYCFSRENSFVDFLQKNIRSGSICINDVGKQASNLNLPFGGVGDSGHGRYRGQRGVETFSYERAIAKRYFIHDFFEALPPRGKMAAFLKKWLR